MSDWLQSFKDSLKIKLRPAERTAFCRGCDKEMHKGEYLVATYSHRNRGQSIFFCLECADDIGNLVKEHKENNATI